MKSTIQITVRNVWGNRTLYPANDQAKLLAQLAGTTTLTPATLKLAEQMGFTVEVVQAAQDWRAA